MSERVQPTKEEYESYQYNEPLNLMGHFGWVLINDQFGFVLSSRRRIYFMCDTRTRIEQSGFDIKPSDKAWIGVFSTELNNKRVFFIGNEMPLVLAKIKGSPRSIMLFHTSPISYKLLDYTETELRERLTRGLKD